MRRILPATFTGLEKGLKILSGVLTGPLGFGVIQEKQRFVIRRFGKLDRVIEPGIRWAPIFCMVDEVNIATQTFKKEKLKMLDNSSTPILLSLIANYHIEYPENWVIIAQQNQHLIANTIEYSVRNIIKTFPFESNDKNDIRSNSEQIKEKIITLCNKNFEEFGVVLDKIEITESNYAPEILQNMLVRQQAQATIDAKKELVDGSVGIVQDVIRQLDLSKEAKEKLAINLLTILTSSTSPTPFMKL